MNALPRFFLNTIHDEQGVWPGTDLKETKQKRRLLPKKLENCKDMNVVESFSQFELNRQPSINWRERMPRRSQEPRDNSPLYKQDKSLQNQSSTSYSLLCAPSRLQHSMIQSNCNEGGK